MPVCLVHYLTVVVRYLDHLVVFLWSQIHEIVFGWIIMLAAYDNLIVKVRSGRFSRITYLSDDLSAGYFLPNTDLELIHVPIKGLITITMVDDKTFAITLFPGSELNLAIACRIDFCADLGGEVHT